MDAATATVLGNLAAKTGRSVEQWLAIARPLVAVRGIDEVDTELLIWLRDAYQRAG